MRGILLIDHGSRRSAANSQLGAVAAELEQALRAGGEATIVEHAHMELAAPDIATAVSQCVRRGATYIVAVPCMLSRGKHVTSDIPNLLADAVGVHPGVTFRIAAPLLEQPGFVDLLRKAADGSAASE